MKEGVLADSDREKLLDSGIKIAPSSRMKLLDEEFIDYKALTTPSEKLISILSNCQMKKGKLC